MTMNRKLAGLLCCLLCLCLCLSACKKDDPTTVPTTQLPKDAIYTITAKTAGGMVFEGLVAYVYEDNTEDDLLTYGTLDANGSFTFTAPESDKYTVRFDNFPSEGYDLKEYYPITSTTTDIVLTSSVIGGKDALEAGKTYALGDVMRDFTVTTVDGQELTISEILKTKQAVMLNFWYTGCDPCKAEFPMLQAAYAAYSDKIEVITMNPTDISGDTPEKIRDFRDQFGLTMPMATCSGQWLNALGSAAYPTTVIIDRYGVVCLKVIGSVVEEGVFEATFEHFSADNYQQKLMHNGFDDIHVVEYPVGHEKNPFQAHGAIGEFEATVEAGAQFHTLFYKASGVIIRIENPNAYMIWGEERYEADKNGVVEFEMVCEDIISGQSVIIGNSGDAKETFRVQVLIAQGIFSNPYEGQLGEYKVTVKENNSQGVFYDYVATADGILTMTVTANTSKYFDIQLYNLNTYAVRTLQEEELVDENGNRYVSIVVNQGDVVSIGFQSTPNANNEYKKVTIESVLTFSEGFEVLPNYTLSFTDGEGNPMAGVSVNVTGDGVNETFVSDELGQIAMILPTGIYTVKVTVPEGYECQTTQFLLTDSNPHKDVVLTVYVPQEVPYTVYVVDELGNPVANAAVVLGDSFAYTDAKGMVSVILLESKDYVATVVPPEGYTIDKKDHAFGNKTTITVVVYQAPDTLDEIDYTVTVLGPDGNPYTDVLVRFDSEDGSVSVTEPVDGSGKITVRMAETNYRVTLVFNSGNKLGYEPTAAYLTPDKASSTLELAQILTEPNGTIGVGDLEYNTFDILPGNYFVNLEGLDIQYFLFSPEEPGVYTFTTTNPDAAISFWNSPFFPMDCSSEYVKDNVCTLEVKQAGPTYVIAVSGGEGISGTVLKAVRTGDVQENPMVYETYEGTTVPTAPYQVTETGTKTWLDLSVEQTIVKGDDGLYHLGAADGPVVYIDLINAHYNISISALVNNSAMVNYEFDENGKPVKRTDYTGCMLSYVANVDAKHGVYVLTDDLMTIMRNHGKTAGWYDPNSPTYLFEGENVLESNGWMFLLCVFA